jgi:hypothetical protein
MAERAYGKIIAEAMADADFKRKLMADPAGTLRERGIAVPEGTEVVVVEDTSDRRTLVIPPTPGELTDAQLESVAGGWNPAAGDPDVATSQSCK